MIKFAFWDTQRTAYRFFDTIDEVKLAIAEVAYAQHLAHTLGSPYSIVTYNEDGSETWQGTDGTEIANPQDIIQAIANSIPIPPAGIVIPQEPPQDNSLPPDPDA